MNKLATKYTNKKRNFNKKDLATKLDRLADRVAKRKVYTVQKTEYGYNIINYVTKEIFVQDIPFLNIAQSYTTTLNSDSDVYSGMNMQKHVNIYHKHLNDVLFYKHTIRNSNDIEKVFTAGVRMADSLQFIHEAKKHLAYF